MTKPQLLLVDDDRHVLESMADWLRGQGYELDASAGYADALEQPAPQDVRPGAGRRPAPRRRRLRSARTMPPQLARRRKSILITGYGTPDGAIEAIRAGAFDYLTKPLIDDELLMAIERAISQRSVHTRKRQPPRAARPPLRHGQHRRPRPADAAKCST